MKVKTCIALSDKGLDKKVNSFLEQDIEIIEIKFSMSSFGYGAMIIYQERG